MFCVKCGAEIAEGHGFCARCGNPLPEATPPPEPSPPSEPATPQELETPTTPEPSFPPEAGAMPIQAPAATGGGASEQPPHTTTPRIKVALFGSLLVMLMLAASFGISFAVVEWRGADDRESIEINQGADWVACQLTITNQLVEEGEAGVLLSEDLVGRMKDTCGITSDLWVLCAHDETFSLSDEELLVFGAGHAADIAESCREQVR